MKLKKSVLLAGLMGMMLLTGCSRSQMNYQIAEAIGTAGQYENNEPVETPKMAAARKLVEESESEEEGLVAVLDEAATLAAGYNYEEAISVLNTLTGEASRDERVDAARTEYEQGDASLVNWTGDIPHLCFPVLIEDTMMAFDGDSNASSYDTSMVTTDEFKDILQSLYDNNYILIDMESIAALVTDDRGTTSMTSQTLRLPEGKKPIVLSQDNLNYATVTNGDGIATKLVLDDEGNVKAQYTDSEGHDQVGDYDFIPILNSFIEEHPDFSFKNARGIVSVSGEDGVFGYALTDDNKSTIRSISSALTSGNWRIACAGWSHGYMNDLTDEAFEEEITNWMTEIGSLTGDANILFYPYGQEVTYPSEKLTCLLDNGLVYLCGLWGDTDFLEIGDGYMRMTRRFVDGYTLQNASSYFTDFFDAGAILDDDR